jgi:16S rRNA G1207 methylase RsmC
VLEPSAGTGHLVDPIRARCPKVNTAAVEVSGRLAAGLGAKLGEVVIGDFLSMGEADLGTFDRVVMNPPFDNGVDIKHVEHARALLRKGGLLVGICADGPRQQKVLRPEVEASGGIWEPLPAGTFEGTSVRAVLFTLGAKH